MAATSSDAEHQSVSRNESLGPSVRERNVIEGQN